MLRRSGLGILIVSIEVVVAWLAFIEGIVFQIALRDAQAEIDLVVVSTNIVKIVVAAEIVFRLFVVVEGLLFYFVGPLHARALDSNLRRWRGR